MTRYARYKKTFNPKTLTDETDDLTAQEKTQIAIDKKQNIEILRKSRDTRPNVKKQRCLCCRQMGHSLSNCPMKTNTGGNNSICYNCGSNAHALKFCPLPREANLRYASCFICKEQGHLSSACPSNERGIYPNGGGCRHCGSNKHLARDCRPTATNSKASEKFNSVAIGTNADADDDITFSALKSIQDERGERQKKKKLESTSQKHKVVKF